MATLLQAGSTLSPQEIGRLTESRRSEVPYHWTSPICPNFSEWRRGDLILVHRIPGNFDPFGGLLEGSQKIWLMQHGHPAARHGDVTHAGIYVGNGRMVDAVPRIGVRNISVWELASVRHLQLRRLDDDYDCDAVADFALARVGLHYSVANLIADQFIVADPLEDMTGVYCTQLIQRAVVQTDVYRRNLAIGPDSDPFFPAVLVDHPSLSRVDVYWQQCWKGPSRFFEPI